jgi:hypothetical protein
MAGANVDEVDVEPVELGDERGRAFSLASQARQS